MATKKKPTRPPGSLTPGPSITELAEMPRCTFTIDERLLLLIESVEDLLERAARAGNWQAQIAATKMTLEVLLATREKQREKLNAAGTDTTEPDFSDVKDIDQLRAIASGATQ